MKVSCIFFFVFVVFVLGAPDIIEAKCCSSNVARDKTIAGTVGLATGSAIEYGQVKTKPEEGSE